MPIGDTFGGGTIVYILQPGDQNYNALVEGGIIATAGDISTGLSPSTTLIDWYGGSYGVKTSANDRAVTTGVTNTQKIVAEQGPGYYAAAVCQDLSLGGQTDWQLPSIDELVILYSVLGLTGAYWSSTEYEAGWNFVRVVNSGQVGSSAKGEGLKVRAIRYY